MDVLAHNGSAILGGAEIATARLLHGLQSRGHRVLLLCRDRGMRQRLAKFDIPVDVLRIGGTLMLPDALHFAIRLRRARPDAVILTTFKKVALAALGARLARVPRVIQRVGLSTDVPRTALYRFALPRFVDTIVLNAEEMREPFLAAAPRVDPRRVVTIHNGVRTPAAGRPRAEVRRSLAIPEGARVFGSVARLATQKRFERLIDALAALPPDVHCLIVGEGPDRATLEARAAELGVRGRLRLPGFRTEVGEVLGALDVFVVASDREGMSNAMLEAMAVGVPMVSTPVSGAREALEPLGDGSVPGIVTPAEDLIPTLHAILDDPGRRASMAAAAKARVHERFDFERLLDRWEEVLSGEPATPRSRVEGR